MATKSILKSINIKRKKSALSLISAVENASGKHSKEVIYSRPCSEASREEIRAMFGKAK